MALPPKVFRTSFSSGKHFSKRFVERFDDPWPKGGHQSRPGDNQIQIFTRVTKLSNDKILQLNFLGQFCAVLWYSFGVSPTHPSTHQTLFSVSKSGNFCDLKKLFLNKREGIFCGLFLCTVCSNCVVSPYPWWQFKWKRAMQATTKIATKSTKYNWKDYSCTLF